MTGFYPRPPRVRKRQPVLTELKHMAGRDIHDTEEHRIMFARTRKEKNVGKVCLIFNAILNFEINILNKIIAIPSLLNPHRL